MAKIEFKGIEKYQSVLKDIERDVEGILKVAVYDGAAIVADAVKAATPVDTGDLRDSLGLAKMRNDNGYVNTKLGFDGYDSKGVANSLKARAYESGTSNQPKRPFIRPAVRAAKSAAEFAMGKTLDKELEKYVK